MLFAFLSFSQGPVLASHTADTCPGPRPGVGSTESHLLWLEVTVAQFSAQAPPLCQSCVCALRATGLGRVGGRQPRVLMGLLGSLQGLAVAACGPGPPGAGSHTLRQCPVPPSGQ